MAADTTTLTEKMRAALRISSTSEKITEEINDCIAACKMDLQDVGVKKLDETDALIIRAITLYCKAEFGYSDKSEQFWKSYECLKTHLSLSSEYTGGETPDSTDDEVNEGDMVDSTADINVAADGAEKKIYMVKNTDGEAGNLYSEYMVIDGKLEKVGDWKVDLSSYAKTTEVTAAIANALTAYAKTADVTKAINAAVAGLIQLDDLSVASTGAGNVVTGLAYDNKTGKFTVTKGLTALTEADFTEITQQEVKAMFA